MTSEIKLARPEVLLKTEQWIAFVLRYGVILSASIISFGLFIRVFRLAPVNGDSEQIVRDLTSGIVSTAIVVPSTISEFFIGLRTANADVIICLGLIVLIGLPVIRVSMTVVLFLVERDFIYLGITLFVLGALLTGIFMGKGL